MRRILALFCAALSVAALVLVTRTATSPVAHAGTNGGNNGEFIIRCPMTGEVQRIDPIIDGSGISGHYHMFFGHFNVMATSTADGLRKQGTGPTISTCQDPNDTAAYWAPESFMPSATSTTGCVINPTGGYLCPFLPGCTPLGGGSTNFSCGTNPSSTIYVRAYYLTTSGPNTGELPKGLIMAVGTPDAGSPPTSINHVFWDCGATTVNGVQEQTPESIWPYTCSLFPFANNEGVTGIIDFPSCWNGQSSFQTPNGTAMVPGYIDPQISQTLSANNDLAYPPATGGCGALSPQGTYHPVPHLSLRIHYTGLGLSGGPSISTDSQTIYPSACPQSQPGPGFPWTCSTQAQMGQSVPPDDIALDLSSSSAQGPVVGGWYTEHADYWQTWQQGVSPPGTGDPNTGTLNSLTHYCLQDGITCGFMPSSKPGNPPYPPPPGT